MLLLLSFILLLLGGYLQFHLRTQIGENSKNTIKPKSDILREINKILPELRNHKESWRKILNSNRLKRDQVESKYINTAEYEHKLQLADNKAIKDHESELRKYNEHLKLEAKRIKFESEQFLHIYRQSQVSFAEYDRINNDLDLDKIISNMEFLKQKIQSHK